MNKLDSVILIFNKLLPNSKTLLKMSFQVLIILFPITKSKMILMTSILTIQLLSIILNKPKAIFKSTMIFKILRDIIYRISYLKVVRYQRMNNLLKIINKKLLKHKLGKTWEIKEWNWKIQMKALSIADADSWQQKILWWKNTILLQIFWNQ